MQFVKLEQCMATALVMLLVACKTSPDKDSKNAAANRIRLDCSVNPPIRTDMREDGVTIESRGPIDTAGKACAEVDKMTAKRSGKWINYQEDGVKILSQGEFANGKKTGPWQTFSPSGNLIKESTYAAGKLDAVEMQYFDNADKTWKSHITYATGVKNGLAKERKTPDAQCITTGNFKAGIKDGHWVECKYNAQTKIASKEFEGAYANGQKSGKAQFFHSNGKLQSTGNYTPNRECIEKLRDAEKNDAKKIAACARRTGNWTYYHSTGTVGMKGTYDTNGKKHGKWTEYYRNGDIAAEGAYRDNRRTAWSYFKTGREIYAKIEYAENSVLPKNVKLFANGKIISEGPVSMGSIAYDADKDQLAIKDFTKKGRWIEYYANGKKSGEGEYMMQKRQGPWKLYNEQGLLVGEGNYAMDKKQGEWRELVNGKFEVRKYMLGNAQ